MSLRLGEVWAEHVVFYYCRAFARPHFAKPISRSPMFIGAALGKKLF